MRQRIFVIFPDYFGKVYPTVRCNYAKFSQLAAGYDPAIEVEIRKRWKSNETASIKKKVFSMILPPPNITGELHLGHALTVTVQDVLARWNYMNSIDVCWVPGFDHAGVATQAIVERSLFVKYGLNRQQLGEERLLKELWAWKEAKGNRTAEQMRHLGPVLDWNREIFTLDEKQKESVASAIINLWDAGLVYRENSLVNWSCHLGSVLSDIEVASMKINGPTLLHLPGYEHPVTFGRIIRVAYLVKGKQEEIVVATSRPETLVGDVAVAIHPMDHRYSHLHNNVLQHPITGEFIPVVMDDKVDPNFGTGAVKVTPAHDHLDYEIAKRHNLPIKNVINEEGKLNMECGQYSGMNRWDAREHIIEYLSKKCLLRGIEPHTMQLPICSRSGDVIELLLKPQWFVKCKEMAERASSSVRSNQLLLEPKKYNSVWYNWMENIKDWCISRQVCWGHDIPFYYCTSGSVSKWICARNQQEAFNKAKNIFSSDEITVTKDHDVLDTWFSSALLPFTAHGWPKMTTDLTKFYPLSLMVTGNDILFFWVARMVMLGLQLTDQLPFKKVLLHGIICDNLGRKMSKSKGNVIDPMDIIQGTTVENLKNRINNSHKNGVFSDEELKINLASVEEMFPKGIPKCGADSLRFSLMSCKITNTFINFSVTECQSNKLFCNKLWQATKFALIWCGQFQIRNNIDSFSNISDLDKWILNRLATMVNQVNKSMEIYEFHLATSALKTFIYAELCSVYIEYIKPILKSGHNKDAKICCQVLLHCLDTSFRCLAPFMPHISDELYSKLPNKIHDSVIKCSMPSNFQITDDDVVKKVQDILCVVETIRRIKLENHISNNEKAIVHVVTDELRKFSQFKQLIKVLTRCIEVEVHPECSGFIDTNFLTERIAQKTVIYIQVERKNSEVPSRPSPHKRLKLKKELDRLVKMRMDDGYKKVSLEIQNAHTLKIVKLENEMKQLDELQEKKILN